MRLGVFFRVCGCAIDLFLPRSTFASQFFILILILTLILFELGHTKEILEILEFLTHEKASLGGHTTSKKVTTRTLGK